MMLSIVLFNLIQVQEIGALKDMASGLTLVGALVIAVWWFNARDKQTIARYEALIAAKDAENIRIRAEKDAEIGKIRVENDLRMEKLVDKIAGISDKAINAINEQGNTNKQLVLLLQDMREDLKDRIK